MRRMELRFARKSNIKPERWLSYLPGKQPPELPVRPQVRHDLDAEQVLDILETHENRRHNNGHQRELGDGRVREARAQHVGGRYQYRPSVSTFFTVPYHGEARRGIGRRRILQTPGTNLSELMGWQFRSREAECWSFPMDSNLSLFFS